MWAQADAAGRNRRVSGSAMARLVSHKWACPECAGVGCCRGSSRECETCSPPRNPIPVRKSEWDE
jgi:hypothetical protein